ncbi:VOC family protein [Mesorhizobium sp. UC22_110]|jgi:catechol 2,3-dioxygenase-like lactoylglutathione lyase family enzyme|uniref:VOC family protein n=1 Tax=unclassified Mesorhizobium TaxID=325217 RepID=UPI003672CB5A
MLDHVSIGVADPSRSKTFYDAVLSPLGYSCLSESVGSLGYGGDQISLWILEVARPVPADMGSGLHFCFAAPTHDSVRAFHAATLAHGGNDNGKAGLRADYGDSYFAAFAIDPDGYRIEACCGSGS